jgi:hypothetical protein
MHARIVILLLLLGPAGAAAQSPATTPFGDPAPVPRLSDEAMISLLTMMPGAEVYSLFGHTALRVRDPAIGLDRTYNYGTFDFEQPNFVVRFLRGSLDYQLAISTFDRTLAEYRFLDRPVIEQRLALEAAERQAVFTFLETNLLPDNRLYRYDFLFDNCSTRPRDALEWALRGRLAIDAYAPPAGTFRDLLTPYIAADRGLHFGIDLGLGGPVDREPTPREAAFLPIELFRAIEVATVDGRPLVAQTDTLFWLDGAGLPDPRPHWPALLASLLLLAGVAVTVVPRASRAATVLDVSLLVFAGLAGILLALMWFATEHLVTRWNPDLLWAWPTHLAAAVFVIRRRNVAAGMRVYWAIAAAFALTAGLLSMLGVIVLGSAATPLALLLALRCADRARTEAPAHTAAISADASA